MSGSVLSGSLQRALWALRLRGQAAEDPTAKTLHILMLLLLLLMVPHIGLAEIRHPGNLLITLLGIPMVGTPVTTLVLLRKNAVRAAGIVYLTGMWVGFTSIMAFNGGIYNVALAVYTALAVSAAWLFGYGPALWTAGVCGAVAGVMAILQTKGLGPPRALPGTPFGIWLLMMESILMGVVPVTLVLSSLRRALAQSQRAEEELKIHEQHLEELVQRRTEELVEARDQAQAASRAKSAFLATVSHELRSPLNTILLLSDPTCIHAGTSDACREDLNLIKNSGIYLLHLINDVLDSARIEAGQIVVENAPFDLRGLIREVRGLMQVRAEEKSLDLLVEEMPGWPRFVQADRAKIRHILINLMDNAIKYTDSGKVTLHGDATPADSPNRLRLRFAVADTGIGIAPQDQARIFEPFTRLGNVAARKGTGLGLSITREYVNAIGGSIRVESVLGEGSRFCVDLPVDLVAVGNYDSAETKTPRIAGLAPGQPEYRVLIIDDRPEDRLVLRRLLEEVGFLVQVVETGESGVEIFQAWRPHFIWMDRRLPLMDGLEATRCIRSLEGGQAVKIVGVSASVFPSEREEMLAAGLDDFVRKPYLPNEIFDCMARHLNLRYHWSTTARDEEIGGASAGVSR
jgi:signal transduction histidine kinase/ActR/RegA family two-component response regulator